MVVNVAFLLKVYIRNCFPGVIGIKKLKYQSKNDQNISSVEKAHHIYETYNKNSDTTPSTRFHIYHIIARCTTNGRIPLKDKKYITYVNNNFHQINLQKYTP